MKKIQLNIGKRTKHYQKWLFALVDDEDFDRVSAIFWQVKFHGNTMYARGIDKGSNKSVYMHRFLLLVNDRSKVVDHKDGNGLNNQKENIRICNQSLNGRNRNKEKTNRCTSIYKGVSKNGKKFASRIRVNGELIYLGSFVSEVDAAIHYNNAAKKYFGDFANYNTLPEHQKIKV